VKIISRQTSDMYVETQCIINQSVLLSNEKNTRPLSSFVSR